MPRGKTYDRADLRVLVFKSEIKMPGVVGAGKFELSPSTDCRCIALQMRSQTHHAGSKQKRYRTAQIRRSGALKLNPNDRQRPF